MGEVNCLSKEEAIDCVADLWSLLTEEEQTRFSEHLSVRRFRKSEPIYREGESPEEHIARITALINKAAEAMAVALMERKRRMEARSRKIG